MKQLVFLLLVVVICVGSAKAQPSSPNLLNYQGKVTDPSGSPKNGMFGMQFAFYDSVTGGNQLPSGTPWSETHNVTVANGVFNVLLGSVTTLPATLFEGGPSDSNGPLRFLQVTVDGEVLSPRSRIASAAYAFHADGVSATLTHARAYRTDPGQNIPYGVLTKVQLNAESFDSRGEFNTTTTYKFTTTDSGYYLVSAAMLLNPTDRSQSLHVMKNGSDYLLSIQGKSASGGESQPLSISDVVYLNAGDFVELYALQDGNPGISTLLNAGANVSFLSIHSIP